MPPGRFGNRLAERLGRCLHGAAQDWSHFYVWLVLQAIRDVNARSAALEILEQQAQAAKEQLNASLLLAYTSSGPETKVAYLELAKSSFATLQAIAAEHPSMRLTNENEVDDAIKLMEEEFTRAGYYVMFDASRRQAASAHVHLSQRAKELLR